MIAGRPIVWLYVASAGIACAGIGVAIDVYRYDHGAAAAGVISRSNPGVLFSLAGSSTAASALLIALTLIALRDAPSAGSVVRRAIRVTAASTAVTSAVVAAVTYAASSGLTFGADPGATPSASIALAPTPALLATVVPGFEERARFSGTLTHDGSPLQSDFVGAYVLRDGLVSACQADIPRVDAGRYEITVMADVESSGCGAAGAQVLVLDVRR